MFPSNLEYVKFVQEEHAARLRAEFARPLPRIVPSWLRLRRRTDVSHAARPRTARSA
jgi:hypothetical protein